MKDLKGEQIAWHIVMIVFMAFILVGLALNAKKTNFLIDITGELRGANEHQACTKILGKVTDKSFAYDFSDIVDMKTYEYELEDDDWDHVIYSAVDFSVGDSIRIKWNCMTGENVVYFAY